MQLRKIIPSANAVKEALRDGAKVYAVGSHEDGCGYWYEIRQTVDGIVMMHESGAIPINSVKFDDEVVALFNE